MHDTELFRLSILAITLYLCYSGRFKIREVSELNLLVLQSTLTYKIGGLSPPLLWVIYLCVSAFYEPHDRKALLVLGGLTLLLFIVLSLVDYLRKSSIIYCFTSYGVERKSKYKSAKYSWENVKELEIGNKTIIITYEQPPGKPYIIPILKSNKREIINQLKDIIPAENHSILKLTNKRHFENINV